MTNSIRVAQVLAGAEHGGAENFYTRLVSALETSDLLEQRAFLRGHEHRVRALKQAGLATSTHRFGGRLDLLGRRQYTRSLKQFDPDIVMTWMNRASSFTQASTRYQLVARLGHYYNLKYYQHADYWIGISQGICQHLIQGGMPKDKVIHIPNFADETPVQPLSRGAFDTPEDLPLIVAAGRLHVNKGFDVLLHALDQVPRATLWLAGSGPEEANLKRLCTELGLNERVRFLGWRSDVTALMRTADVFVCPSRHEGLGSIVMESWAHGCPIVATNSQGPGELIDHMNTGLITPVDNADELASAITQVLHSPDLATELVQKARLCYQKYYSKEVITAQYLEFYSRIQRS